LIHWNQSLWRSLARWLATIAGFSLFVIIWGALFTPTLPEVQPTVDPLALERVEAQRDTSFDVENPPTPYVAVDYAEGVDAEWYPKGESPILADLVAEGKLPPVEERVGPEPVVLESVDDIGNFGGSWYRVAVSETDLRLIKDRLSGGTLVRWSTMGEPIVPHIAKGWEHSPDYKEWTFFLRKGLRWSDGELFTADDIMFYWRERNSESVGGQVPAYMVTGDENGEIVKVSNYEVKFVFKKPHPMFLQLMLGYHEPPFLPEHYMAPFHPDTGDQEMIAKEMEARQVASPRGLYWRVREWDNPAHPRMWPWVLRTFQSGNTRSFVRNPYYYAVDPEGNQLPYIDRLFFEIKQRQFVPLALSTGGVSMQARHALFKDYTLLMNQREAYNYEVYHWLSASTSPWTMFVNINRGADSEEGAKKGKLLRQKEFRQALSLAIDRETIIEAEFSGFGEPAQLAPRPESRFHHPKLFKAFTEFDPARASQMLDELGLTQRDAEGMRTFPDGEPMTFFITFTEFTGPGPVQFIVDDWKRVGIRAIARERSRKLFVTERDGLQHDFTVWTSESEFHPFAEPRSFAPIETWAHFAPAYAAWYMNGGMEGEDVEAEIARAQEPPPGSAVRRNFELLEEAYREVDDEKRRALLDELMDIAAEQMWSISITTFPPQPVVVENGFMGVPKNVLFGYAYKTPSNAGIETFFFADPQDSDAAIAEVRREMIEVTPEPTSLAAQEAKSSAGELVGGIIKWVVILSIVAGLGMLAVRHPYVGRRLLVMVPTLLIISIVAFSIIQLPPGDYLQSRIMELEMQGETAEEEIEEIKRVFHLEEPAWQQYFRWMGLYWFFTYDSADRGLLQGDLGRSMETRRPVNEMVGERLLLTVAISLGTILFTWAIALPIGVYSAVRQYSIGDYIFTFIGFIGMCIPNFLLALVLMYWGTEFFGVSLAGLFSPQYSAQPEWTWGKFVDLLKHIWVPIIVVGTAGTAAMIRIMRANLLDELKKPYVTTARARGVRPFKLLVKYPVRIALNPFVSGIGHIFPQLISGGAIVAIVLSLPTVGPLLLNGLLSEDMYLAGSLLMTLSILAVFGTLVSDLLLLWLDPRIRLEGGSK